MLQMAHRHPFEQGDALAQAFLVIGDQPLHRCFGDGGHFCLAASGIRNFIHAFDVDERRVHVKSNQLEMGQRERRLNALDNEA